MYQSENLEKLESQGGQSRLQDMLNFALVGCGRIGRRHATLLSQNQIAGAQLVAVCDIDKQRCSDFSTEFNVDGFESINELMRIKKPDVVIVATPSGLHPAGTLMAARAGAHVVVEKPMALSLADADAMIQVCAEAKRKLFVVKQNRFNLPLQELKQAVDAGRLGAPILGTVRVRWCRDDSYYELDEWRGTWALDGGVLANQAIHHVDALQWLLGDVESVYARGETFNSSVEVEDTALAILKFRSGALGSIEATTAVRPRDIEGSISVIGDAGIVEVSGKAMNRVEVWETRSTDEGISESVSENPPDVYGFGHQRYLEHVVDCIVNDTSQLVDGIEGKKSLELVLAIYHSIETGQEVTLRREQFHSRMGVR